MSEQDTLRARLRIIAQGLCWAAARSKASADNENYACGVTIAEAELAATALFEAAAALHAEGDRPALRAQLEQAQAENTRLREALKRYALHSNACMGQNAVEMVKGAAWRCYCGLQAALTGPPPETGECK
jgi:hypothetical protein